MCSILFTVTVGWKVKAQSKHRPLAGTEVTAQRARASWLPLPLGSFRKQITICPSFAVKIRISEHANKLWCIPLYIVYKRIILHIWLMPCLVTWLWQLTWFIAVFHTLLRKTISDSVTAAQLSLSCRKGPYTKEPVNCKSSYWLSLLSSDLIMWSIISALTALHPRHGEESHRELILYIKHDVCISICEVLRGCVEEKRIPITCL